MDNDESQPFIFTSGAFLPKRFRRNRFFGQAWNDYSYTSGTYGWLAEAGLGGFDIRFGLFRSVFDNDVATADLLFGTDPDGAVADRLIVRQRGDLSASTSGELRVSRSFDEGPRRHSLVASLRARRLDRRYGGGALIDLGPSRSDGPDPRAEPVSVDGAKTRDRVQQATLGIAYQGRWRGLGELTAGIQRTDYLKRVTNPEPGPALPGNARFALAAQRDRGALPDVAPRALCRLCARPGGKPGRAAGSGQPERGATGDPDPAVRRRPALGGYARVTAVVGLFEISKPYFNVDPARRFRRRGAVTNRGIEMSVAGEIAPGLNLVAGTVLLDARLDGDEVASGAIGRRPVGSFVRRTILSVDYRVPAVEGLSVDALLDSSSARVANVANSQSIPGRTLVNVGARYRFRVGEAPILLRAQVTNLFNSFGWNVSGSGYFTPIAARTLPAHPRRRSLASARQGWTFAALCPIGPRVARRFSSAGRAAVL